VKGSVAIVVATALALVVVPAALTITVTGSITNTDPTQTDRLFRSGIPSTCAAPTSGAIFGDAQQHHYDAYTYTNTSASPQCVTVDMTTACTGTNFIFGAAYSSFVPTDILQNWLADSGSSPNPSQSFSFNAPAQSSFQVVVSEVTADAGCPSYTLDVNGTGIVAGLPGTITVTKHLVSNPLDPAKFNLRIDGTTYAANVGNGGTTGAVLVGSGSHTVSETAGTNANLGNYTARIECSDGAAGYGTSLSGVQVNSGENITCTITNTRKLFRVG
jgi:hypothetical protein